MAKCNDLIPVETIESRILLIRGQRVILDVDLAELYGVSTGRLNEQIRRNIERFPHDFMFQLTMKEARNPRLEYVNLKRGKNIKYLPYAFTEYGAVMAANVLRSKRAIQASIFVVRAFVKLKQLLTSHKELAKKLEELEQAVAVHDKSICSLFEAIRKLMSPTPSKSKRIGFIKDSE